MPGRERQLLESLWHGAWAEDSRVEARCIEGLLPVRVADKAVEKSGSVELPSDARTTGEYRAESGNTHPRKQRDRNRYTASGRDAIGSPIDVAHFLVRSRS